MRKVFLFLLFTAFLSLISVKAQTIQPTIYSDLVIQIRPTKTRPTIRPLSVGQSDIEAYYNNEALTFVFNRDLGDADIVVTNLTTGEMMCDNVSGISSTIIYLSGHEGYYRIIVHTESMDYVGEFNL